MENKNKENEALLASLKGIPKPSKTKSITLVEKSQPISTIEFTRQQFIKGVGEEETNKKVKKKKSVKKKSQLKKFLKKKTVSTPILKKSQVTVVVRQPQKAPSDRNRFFTSQFEIEKKELFFK